MHLLQRIFLFENDGCVRFGNGGRGRRPSVRQEGKLLFDHAAENRVIHIAGCGDEHIARSVNAMVEVEQHAAFELLDCFACSQDGLAEAVAFPEIAQKGFVEDELGRICLHLDLFENDALFLFDVLAAEDRMQDQVGQDVEREGHMLIEDFGVETDQFLTGEGIEASANRIHRAGDVFGRTRLRALEDHVFNEMRDAILGSVLHSRTAGHPDS